MHTQNVLTNSIISMCPTRTHCIAVRYFQQEKITYWWKWCKEGLKWRRQQTKSTYFAKNQRLWIKFSFDSHKIKDLYRSEGIQQKQPSRDVFRKRCSENMQQIYRRTPMSKCEFNKVHFGIGVLLRIKFADAYFQNTFF